jgi:cell cycle checkpoint protein
VDSDDGVNFDTATSAGTRKIVQREITLDGRTSATTSPAKRMQSKSTPRKVAAKASPASSPQKARKASTDKSDPVKHKSLHNFFGKATDEQRWRRKSQTPDFESDKNGELSDAIEDDDLSDETLQELGQKADTQHNDLDHWKPSFFSASQSNGNGTRPPSTQKFVKPSAPASRAFDSTNTTDGDQDYRTWADRYGPTNLDELAVHKKKVTDVQTWLQGTKNGRSNQRMLILKGPAGTGKTMTMSLLAKSMGMQMISWQNPAVSESGQGNSIAAQFDDFLNRGGQFWSLDFEHGSPIQNLKNDSISKVLVVEDFPASMTRSSSALQSFRSVIFQFISRAKAGSTILLNGQSTSHDFPPAVLIISETLLSSSTAFSDSFTAHRLLGRDILNHPLVTAIDFNPIAPTLMTKALDVVIKKEARDSRRRRTPGAAVISKLAEIGDIRNAINSLEFLCLRGGDDSGWSGTVAAKVKRTSKENMAMTDMEKDSISLMSQRETTLDMFHAAGKIVYNKREDPRVLDTKAQPAPKPPDHLMHLYIPKISQVDIGALLNETGTDIQTFISTVHENYVLSCYGDSFVDCFEGCSESLSVSDVLDPESRPIRRVNSANPNAGSIQSNMQSMASDALRQDEISFNVATRGLLFNLPFPVNRGGAVQGSRKQDAFKMFYPSSLRLWKPIEEMQGLLDMFVNGVGDLGNLPSAAKKDAFDGDGGVATWQSRSLGFETYPEPVKYEGPAVAQEVLFQDDTDANAPPPIRLSKDMLVLETLPSMMWILAARKHNTSILEKIVKFKPLSYLSNGDDGFEGEDELNIPPVLNVNRTLASAAASMKQEAPAVEVEQLFITEDDIEDD